MNTHKLLFALFHPICEHIIRPLLHQAGYDFEVKEIDNSPSDSYTRLSPYIDFISAYKANPDNTPAEKIIWQFWWQGNENAPAIVQRCMESVNGHAGDYRVIVLTKDNLQKYITLPDCIRKKHDAGAITHTHLSDYIRVALLEKYGGVWIDATVMLTGPIPQDILNADFFFYRATGWALPQNIPTPSLFPAMRELYKTLGGGVTAASTWFMVGNKKSIFPSCLRQLFELYWSHENKLSNYYLLHQFISLCITYNKTCRNDFSNMPNHDNIQPHLLLFSLQESFNKDTRNDIISRSKIHKLSYKFQNKTFNSSSFYQAILDKTFI